MNRTHVTLAVCTALLGLSGCVHDNKVRERTSVSAVTNEEATGDREEPGKTRMNYTVVGDNVALNRTGQNAEANGTDGSKGNSTLAQGENECQRAVYFETASANLDQNAERQLTQVAECIKRRDIDHALIVGRTDPSGPESYNEELGMKRARAVADYLRSLGVPEQDIRVRSKGEMAAADSKQLWPVERRASVTTQ